MRLSLNIPASAHCTPVHMSVQAILRFLFAGLFIRKIRSRIRTRNEPLLRTSTRGRPTANPRREHRSFTFWQQLCAFVKVRSVRGLGDIQPSTPYLMLQQAIAWAAV
jgi:hypothetical protein